MSFISVSLSANENSGMNRLKIYLVFAVCTLTEICGINIAFAQAVDNQFWFDYTLNAPINKKWSYGGDIGMRGLVSNYQWNQIIIRPVVSYKISDVFAASPGIAWFGTFNRNIGNVNEFRMHQDITARWPDLGFIEFFYRVRVEERFFFFEDDQIANRFNLRLRGLIGVESDDIYVLEARRPIYFQSIFEGFITPDQNADELFINQTRFHLAFGHRLSSDFRYELHYIRQGSRLYVDDGIDIGQNIYRLRFFHRIQNRADK
jgi:hypothetical protein